VRCKPRAVQSLRLAILVGGLSTWVLLLGPIGVAHGGGPIRHYRRPHSRANARATSKRGTRSALPRTPPDPLATTAIRRYLAGRAGSVSIAVEDLADPVGYIEWDFNPNARYQTASIVKADILETLLHHYGGPLTGSAAAVATGMIEDSDNDDATDLWNLADGATGVTAYNSAIGLTHTDPNAYGYWGESLTTAADQVKLLTQLVLPSRLLTTAARLYELDLMEHVDPGQDWGVSGGVPRSVSVALKNGWLPLSSDSDWEVNSIGRVHGDGRWYLIAVLTAHDPGEEYGIDTIDHVSSLIYQDLKPH
jgi:Beta-lactamase enzyme family